MNNLKILAVDDIQDNLISLGALIRDIFPDASVLMATNGPKALELASVEDPDIILLDIVMPGMDGYEVCRQLKQDMHLRQIPVVFLTAMKSVSETRVKALEAGAEGFLSKPIDEPELTAQIRAMAKIRESNIHRKLEKEQLAEMVAQKTVELEKSRNDTLVILEDLKTEYAARLQGEEKIRLLSTAIEQSPVCIVITDSKGFIEYVNPKFTEITQYRAQEVLGKTPAFLKSGFHDNAFYSRLWQTLSEGKDWEGELHNVKKDGTLYWEKATISPIVNESGTTTHFVAIKEDITEKKFLYQELIVAKERAEESNRLKTAFLQNISHEIRTPMNGILGFAELLKSPGLSGAEQIEFVRIIEQSGKRMLNLINDIVDISKIESGQMDMQIQGANLNPVMNDLLMFFRPEAQSKGLSLTLECFLPEGQDAVSTDVTKITQILSNLINNALKFTLKGSIVFGYVLKEDVLEFFVKDTGIGIPDNQKDLIFERFIQGNMSLTRAYEGSGLGLSIARALVGLLGGSIWVESKVDRGSTFSFTIPFVPLNQPSEEKNQLADGGFDLSRHTILVVEDDPVSRVYLTSILHNMGARTVTAEDGAEAVEKMSDENKIDLVLMDLKMPVMDGYEATRRIKKIKPAIPVIAQTANAFNEELEQALQAGCDDVLTKPIQSEALFRRIQMYLNPKR